MTSFRDREHGFEAKFAHDEATKFKATARRNRLIGQWASQKLGLTGDAAESYEKDLVTFDLDNPGADGVFKRIRTDFDTHGVAQSDHQIRRTMDEFMIQALSDVKAGI